MHEMSVFSLWLTLLQKNAPVRTLWASIRLPSLRQGCHILLILWQRVPASSKTNWQSTSSFRPYPEYWTGLVKIHEVHTSYPNIKRREPLLPSCSVDPPLHCKQQEAQNKNYYPVPPHLHSPPRSVPSSLPPVVC